MAKIANSPVVSVIIPTYNRAHFLGETIQSVLNQTYKDFEIVIVDDGSTDKTEELVKSFSDGRLRYIKLGKNTGSSAAPRNAGLKAASGKYIALLDSDDAWLPNKLKLEVEFLDTHPSVSMVCSNYTYFGSRGRPKKTGFEGVPLASGYGLKELFFHNPISASAVLIKKSCFEKVGDFDESLVQCGDVDMWLRIAAHFEIDYINTPLSKYRFHERNMHLKPEGCIRGFRTMRIKWIQKIPLNKVELKTLRNRFHRSYPHWIGWFLGNSTPPETRELCREYIRLYPYDPFAYVFWLLTFLPSLFTRSLISYLRKMKHSLMRKSSDN